MTGTTSEILLIPWGDTVAKGTPFKLDGESARLVVQSFQRNGVSLPIDYGHASLHGQNSAPDGTAPAAGWIKQLKAVPGKGLFGVVDWTKTAAERIAARAYRYISPVLLTRASDRRVVELHSAGLTNCPAIPGMPPLS